MCAKVVVANWVHSEVLDYLSQYGDVIANSHREPLPRSTLIERCKDADALIAFMSESVDESFLSACLNLRIIACALKGYNNFDVEACTRHGVWLTIIPDLLTAPTAELTVGLMIALGRNILASDGSVRDGEFAGWRGSFAGRSLDESTIGLIGAGALGKTIARRLAGFRCQILYYDRECLAPAQEDELRLRRVTLPELQARSDFVVLALPLTQETVHLIDKKFLVEMKAGSYLINPSRGSLVDEEAVADALEAGYLAGYAADTFECEDFARPDRPDSINARLLCSEKTVLTPHRGSAIDTIRLAISQAAAESVVQCLKGERPKGAVNEPAGTNG